MKWTLKKLQEEANKYTTRNNFRKNSSSAYIIAHRRGLLNEICMHMPKDLKIGNHPSNFKFTKEMVIKDAAKYPSKIKWKKHSKYLYNKALKSGWMQECSTHMTRPIVHNKKWTKITCMYDASKYKTIVQWVENSQPAYMASKKFGWFKECTLHMVRPEIHNKKWTKLTCAQDALKYETVIQWMENSICSYMASQKHGWFQECIIHMKKSYGTSGPEKILFNIIRSFYSSAKKLRCKKIRIPNKPYIKGFDIDIYIPELNKGIEFDGTYWHSEKTLSVTKSHWPLEDIKNYHQIKDDYFLSIGIEILHIKEEDWKLDKQSCLQKCYDFLSIKL